jgi:hypothetical protein
MEDTDFDVEVPLLMDYCSQSGGEEEVESEDEDDVGVESLDYDTIHNVVHDTLLKKRQSKIRRIYGYHYTTTTSTLHSTALHYQIWCSQIAESVVSHSR